MKVSGVKLLSTIAASAVVGAGALVVAVTQPDDNAVADSTMKTGVTQTATQPPATPPIAKAAPVITGPAPLPPEEQGLPG